MKFVSNQWIIIIIYPAHSKNIYRNNLCVAYTNPTTGGVLYRAVVLHSQHNNTSTFFITLINQSIHPHPTNLQSAKKKYEEERKERDSTEQEGRNW